MNLMKLNIYLGARIGARVSCLRRINYQRINSFNSYEQSSNQSDQFHLVLEAQLHLGFILYDVTFEDNLGKISNLQLCQIDGQVHCKYVTSYENAPRIAYVNDSS